MKKLLIILIVSCFGCGEDIKDLFTTDYEYVVEGAGTSSADVTYINEDGSIEQQTVALPWRFSYEIAQDENFFAYISAQNNSYHGTIYVKLYIDSDATQADCIGSFCIATVHS